MSRQKTKPSNNRQLRPDDICENRLSAYRRDDLHQEPTLRFSPAAWAKLLYLRDLGDTEVGGFGISAADDLLFVEDVQLVKQLCTGASVAFDDQAVANFFDCQVDMGRLPAQFGRLWIHTHPGSSPEPSGIDEDTFARVFGGTDWSIMFILARSGPCYSRLSFHVGPGGNVELPVEVDYRRPFPASDHAAWQQEYAACVQPAKPAWRSQHDPLLLTDAVSLLEPWADDDWLLGWEDHYDEYQQGVTDTTEASYAI